MNQRQRLAGVLSVDREVEIEREDAVTRVELGHAHDTASASDMGRSRYLLCMA